MPEGASCGRWATRVLIPTSTHAAGLRAFTGDRADITTPPSRCVDALSLNGASPAALTFVTDRAAGSAPPTAMRSATTAGALEVFRDPPARRAAGFMVIRHYGQGSAPPSARPVRPDQRYRIEVDAALRGGGFPTTAPLLLARDRTAPMAPALTSVVIRAATTPRAAARRRGRAAAQRRRRGRRGLPHAGAAAQRDDERAAAVAAPASTMRTRACRGPGRRWYSTAGSPPAPRAPRQARCRASRRRWPIGAGRSRSACAPGAVPGVDAGQRWRCWAMLLSGTLAAITQCAGARQRARGRAKARATRAAAGRDTQLRDENGSA